MLFWIVSAVLAFLATLSAIIPLTRRARENSDSFELDKALYKARLNEIGRDRELGRISAGEADAAIAEEGRKLIALSKSAEAKSGSFSGQFSTFSSRALTVAILVFVPAMSLGLYMYLGKPGVPDQSLSARMQVSPENQPIELLIAKAEAHLAANPDDPKGWAVLAPVYQRIGRIEDAVAAWRNVYRLDPEHAEISAILGEAIVSEKEGVVTEEARALFAEELGKNPASARARFFLAMALSQEGRHEEAANAWQTLIDGANPQSPWLAAAREFRDTARKMAGMPETADGNTVNGPSQEQIEATQEMSSADRSAMIEGMVANLAAKLEENPSDKQGWQRLIRAYMVLGRKEDALKAVETALASNAGDENFKNEMNAARKSLSQQ